MATSPQHNATQPASPTPPESWMNNAQCHHVDPAIFFPTGPADHDEAQRICAACTVRDECLGFALDHHIKHGIWGGSTERERQHIREQRRTRRTPAA